MIAATVLLLATAAKTKSSGNFDLLFIVIILYGCLYYFYFRPRRKKMNAQRQNQRKVEVGDMAQTIGGLVGTVVAQGDEFVTIRTQSGAELDFIPTAIAKKYQSTIKDTSDEEPEAQEGDK
ncbi:MAG: preprotein translocase subunit YajC [Acidimicrobiales bacterium]|jgi:preprotein translocase YajC subunit